MKNVMLLLAFLLSANALPAQTIRKRVDSLMEYYAQTFDYNGVAFVSSKGQTLLNKGYGYKDRYRNLKNDPNSIFMIGSITKQFTAGIILMLAKENKLRLTDKLNRYFPDYKSGDKITLEHLLTHTSGIYNYTDDTLWLKHPTTSVTQEQMLAIFKDKPLAFEPGSKFDYSNSNYILLSYVIEQITRKPYTVVARERILAPLDMTHSGFDFTHLKSPDKATGYNCILIDSFHTEPIEDSTQSLGAGALYSTVEDLYKWHRALQSYTLLDKEWQQKAYMPYKEHYGYGLLITDNLAGKKVYAHSGSINGFNTYFLRVEQEDVCIALLTNVRFGGANNNTIAKNLVRCMYDTGFRIPAIRKEIALSKDIMKRYEGEYVLTLDTSISIKFSIRGNYFLLKITNQPEDRIFPQSETMFFAKTADAQFEFVKDEKRGYKMVLHQHGQLFETIKRM